MVSDRLTARVIGVLFVVGTTTAIVGGSLLAPTEGTDPLVRAAANAPQVVTGAVLEIVLVLSVVAIGALAYPVLKRSDEGLALGYLASRLLEGALLLAATASSLLVLELGRADTVVAGDAPALVELLATARASTYLLGSLVMLGVSTLVFNWLLLRSRLVPTWLSGWGLVAGVLIGVRGIIELYGVELAGAVQAVLAAPIALQEMVLAVLLIARGFDTSRIGPPPDAVGHRTTIDLRFEQHA